MASKVSEETLRVTKPLPNLASIVNDAQEDLLKLKGGFSAAMKETREHMKETVGRYSAALTELSAKMDSAKYAFDMMSRLLAGYMPTNEAMKSLDLVLPSVTDEGYVDSVTKLAKEGAHDLWRIAFLADLMHDFKASMASLEDKRTALSERLANRTANDNENELRVARNLLDKCSTSLSVMYERRRKVLELFLNYRKRLADDIAKATNRMAAGFAGFDPKVVPPVQQASLKRAFEQIEEYDSSLCLKNAKDKSTYSDRIKRRFTGR